MALLFAKPVAVVHRLPGSYLDGVWTPTIEPMPVTHSLGIQPATTADYERMEATASGRRTGALLVAYADPSVTLKVAGENGHPGDLVMHDDRRWLVVGRADWTILGDADTSHRRYLLALEAEHSAGEVMA